MFSWLMNPMMLGLGALAVASPILIHLLNKRRFKIIEWAAMDFLFEAEKKNRRRVRIENFILLALRCLAMLLIGLLLGRPFLPSSMTKLLNQKPKFERVVLLDDSLSQRVLTDTMPTFQVAKDALKAMVQKEASSAESENWFTLMLASRPDELVYDKHPLTEGTVGEIITVIDDLECSDAVSDYSVSLDKLKARVSSPAESIGFVSYVFSDLRQRDWVASDDAAETAPNKLMQDIAESSEGSFVIDVAGPNDGNLAITSVRPEDMEVANTVIRFNVEVTNFGNATVSDVRVLLQVDDSQPAYETIASIAPGQSQQIMFRHLFNAEDLDPLNLGLRDEDAPSFKNHRVVAEIDRQSLSAETLASDQLLEDSRAVYASRTLNGIPVLLVDGDPSSVSVRSETHYLNRLRMFGTGLDIQAVTVSELETVSLSKYRAIFLCNVDEASPDRIKSIRQWVNDGGSLVLMPGNRVRASTFNSTFYDEGNGLSPVELVAMAGDPTMSKWVNFEVSPQIHPSLRVILGSDETSLGNVDVFSWWTSKIDESKVGKEYDVPLRLSDEGNSPAMVDRSFGKGKVITFALPADGDWTMWPSSPTFAVVMLDMIYYMVGNSGRDESEVAVGGTLNVPVDLSRYQNRVTMRDPKNEKTEKTAKPIDETEDAEKSVLYRASFENIRQLGFYDVGLQRHSGETDSLLFASNVDPSEGQLKRMGATALAGDFFNDKISLVSAADLKEQTVSGGTTEMWMWILSLLFVVLVIEQFLGWWFGKKR